MIQLSHIGEKLLAEMLSESEKVRASVCGEFISTMKSNIFEPELRLNNCGPLSFDGVHRIDVAVLNFETNICYPIEAKLGFDRLGKSEFEKRFMGVCGTSHNNTRVKGSMISILERKLPSDCIEHDLTVSWRGRTFTVSPCWGLVVRRKVINKWLQLGGPNLSNNCRVTEFETLVESYGSEDEFNSLVGRLVSFNYFKKWQCNT